VSEVKEEKREWEETASLLQEKNQTMTSYFTVLVNKQKRGYKWLRDEWEAQQSKMNKETVKVLSSSKFKPSKKVTHKISETENNDDNDPPSDLIDNDSHDTKYFNLIQVTHTH